MDASLVRIADMLPEQRDRWRSLAGRAVEANPFFDADFVTVAHSYLNRGEDIHVAMAGRPATLDACLPLVRVRNWRRTGMSAWVNRPSWENSSHPIGLGTPLLDRVNGIEAFSAIIELLRRRAGPRLLILEWMGLLGPADSIISGAADRSRAAQVLYEQWNRAAISRRPGDTYLEAALGASHRRELRRRRRRLAEAAGGTLTFSDRGADPIAVEEMIAMEALGWRGALLDQSTAQARRSMFRDLCNTYRDQGRLHVLTLQGGEVNLAMACYIRAGNTLFARKISYNEKFGRYSPGAHLDADIFTWFHSDASLAEVDSCNAPDDTSLDHSWPDSRSLGTVVLSLGGPLHGRITALLPSARQILRRARREMPKYRRVRSRFGR